MAPEKTYYLTIELRTRNAMHFQESRDLELGRGINWKYGEKKKFLYWKSYEEKLKTRET